MTTVVRRPGLLDRLGGSARVTVISGPAGSGKTMLLRSWREEPGHADRVAWVSASSAEPDSQRFWIAAASALRETRAGAALVREMSAAPDLDGWALAERLLRDLAALDEPLWLVIDDVHELEASEVAPQLELMVLRAPPQLRLVLAARHDVRLGLHRLRLDGDLEEIRTDDLRFSREEARELFAAAGADLPEPVVDALYERTEGWAAGLRLAALSVAGHPDPARFAAEFSGSERTVAEYLLAEVLERQPEHVRRLLLRTSILERVNGDLARVLTGDEGGERVLHDLERAGAFTISLDASRTWFRYHQLFAGLLRLKLRHDFPGDVGKLHLVAAEWFASHGFAVEAVRHAQAAGDWRLAGQLLADHWPALHLEGRTATIRELLAGFPAGLPQTDAVLAVVAAAGELARGNLDEAEGLLDTAGEGRAAAGDPLSPQRTRLAIVRLQLAHQRGNLAGVTSQARRLTAMTEATGAALPAPAPAGLAANMSAFAMITLGSTEFWTAGQDAGHHLEQGLTLARQAGLPYLEFTGLALRSEADVYESLPVAAERATAAIELARRHGWESDPAYGVACASMANVLTCDGRLAEAEPWLQRAERAMRADTHLMAAASIRGSRAIVELARGHLTEAASGFEAAETVACKVTGQHHCIALMRSLLVQSLARLGETGRARQALAGLSQPEREYTEIRVTVAALRLAEGDPRAALGELDMPAPALQHPGPVFERIWMAIAAILEAAARNALGEPDAAHLALERALDLAEQDGAVVPFLLYPVPGLLEQHAGHPTAHASLLAGIRDLLAGNAASPGPAAPPRPLLEAPSASELRVLRYLPTNLTVPEIARELHVSPATVRTHVRRLHEKLGTHSRAETVEGARALGLLAPARVPVRS